MAVRNDAVADEGRTRALIDKARALSRLSDESSADPPPSRPERFRDLAVRALRSAEISVGRFAEYMGISRQTAMAYVAGPLEHRRHVRGSHRRRRQSSRQRSTLPT